MKISKLQLLSALFFGAAVACVLNPQPIPPELEGNNTSDAGKANDSGASMADDDGSAPGVSDAQVRDAGISNDAAEGEDAEPGDASIDAPSDAPDDGG